LVGSRACCARTNGLEFAAEGLAAVAATLGIRIVPAPHHTPHLKGKIERLNRTVAQDFLCTLPFYTDGPRDAAGRLYELGAHRSPSSDSPPNSTRGSATTTPLVPMRVWLTKPR